jgi:hypothetical protein
LSAGFITAEKRGILENFTLMTAEEHAIKVSEDVKKIDYFLGNNKRV